MNRWSRENEICACGCGERLKPATRAQELKIKYRSGHATRIKPARPLSERFWEKVDKTADCWVWTHSTFSGGYGQAFTGPGKRCSQAHRVSWEMHNGPIPPALHVLHKCDNPRCVNPSHLFLGTNQDNIADKVAKGRQPRGEAHAHARYTEQQITDMHKMRHQLSPDKLAELFLTTPSRISRILRGARWSHLYVRPLT
jgi:hypothetical protein